MDKAYDLKVLAQYVKEEAAKKGLTIAEEALETLGESIYFGSKRWAKESAVITATKIDDFAAGFYDQLDPIVTSQIQKLDIDGDGK